MSLIHTAVFSTNGRQRVNPAEGAEDVETFVVLEELISRRRYALAVPGHLTGQLSLRKTLELRDSTRNRFRGVYEVVGIIDHDSGAVFGAVPSKRLIRWDLVEFQRSPLGF
jgi:hypothetical protein